MDAGLWLIGMGPGDLGLMSIEGRRIASECQLRFLEGYTATLPAEEEEVLEQYIGEWKRLMRAEIENPTKLLELARTSSVALLVIGDPLQATTHIDLILRARESGIECAVVPGISVTTIVTGVVGLQSYRFGREVTLPHLRRGTVATSPLEFHCENHALGLHTLVLLDLDSSGSGAGLQDPMSLSQAAEVIAAMAIQLVHDPPPHLTEDESARMVFRRTAIDTRLTNPVDDWSVVSCSNVGTKNQRFKFGSIKAVCSGEENGLHCLILPAELQALEQDALNRWS